MKNFTSEELDKALNEIDKLYFEDNLLLQEAIQRIKEGKKDNE